MAELAAAPLRFNLDQPQGFKKFRQVISQNHLLSNIQPHKEALGGGV
jgi:hypothetical protein